MLVNKESILQLLENEIDKLSADYNDQINDLNKQILKLKDEINKLKRENQSLQSNMLVKDEETDYKKKYEMLLKSSMDSNRLNGGVTYELIDEWCLSSSIEDSVLFLSTLNHVLEDGNNLDKAIYMIELMKHNPALLKHKDQKVINLFEKCLTNILVSKHLILSDEDFDELYLSCLELFITLSGSSSVEEISEFIRKNFYKILDNVFYLQLPEILTCFMRVCMYNNLKMEINDIFYEMFEKDWETIESSIFKDDFIFLIWYAFLFDFDEQLIEKSSVSLKWFDESMNELSLYFYLYDSISGNVIPTSEHYKVKVQNFKNGEVLSAREQEAILTKVDSRMKTLFLNPLLKEKENRIEELKSQVIIGEITTDSTEIESIQELKPSERIAKKIETLEKYSKDKSFQHFDTFFSELHSDSNEFDKKDIERIIPIILDLFKVECEDINELDRAYKSAIAFIQQFANSNDVKISLFTNQELMMNRVLDLNEPYIISELARTYSVFNLPNILVTYLNKVIDQWPFIDANIDKRSFMRLFWNIFNNDLETRLFKVLKESASFLKEDIPEAKIYSLYKDPKIDSVKKVTLIEELKRKVTYFDENEIKIIFKSLDRRMKIKVKKANRNSEKDQKNVINSENSQNHVRKMLYVVKISIDHSVSLGRNQILTEEWIQLAIFKDVLFNDRPSYILVKVLSQNHTGKAYVTSSLLQEIISKIGQKRFIDVRSYEENTVKSEKNQLFPWPSTEIKGNAPSDLNEKGQLNEESELKKIGYQITGLTKEKRWSVLEKAVKQLGLKKVSYTIAQNVKLRKGQKNGETKFKYAISEWEYDLEKLKKHYYKNQFTWPSIKISKS